MSLTNDEWREVEQLRGRMAAMEARRTDDFHLAEQRHVAVMAKLDGIEAEVRKTNGRVTKLESVAEIGQVVQKAIYSVGLVLAGALVTALVQRWVG